jgi:hypothetical protein
MIWNLLTWNTWRSYHFNGSRGSREAGVPSVFFWFVNSAKVHSFNRRKMFKNIGILPGPPALQRLMDERDR